MLFYRICYLVGLFLCKIYKNANKNAEMTKNGDKIVILLEKKLRYDSFACHRPLLDTTTTVFTANISANRSPIHACSPLIKMDDGKHGA